MFIIMSENAPSPGEVRVRKTRASKPKVKTGCQTCKIRRVKCDETKPSCLRCLKFGHTCDGYASKSTPKPSQNANNSRLLVPKTISSVDYHHTNPITHSTSSPNPNPRNTPPKLCPSPSRPIFQTQHEHHAFRTFCATTTDHLSSSSSIDLWTRLMHQACETSPSMRDAVLALGTTSHLSSPPSTPENSVGTMRHQFAFLQYSKAPCLLRRDVAGSVYDIRTTLISSLLYHCYEGDSRDGAAVDRVHEGLKMLKDWASSIYGLDGYRKRAPGPLPSITSIHNGMLPGSTAQEEAEQDISKAFDALEIQAMQYADLRAREANEQYRARTQREIDSMPQVFGSVEEARGMLDIVVRRSMRWLRSTMCLHNFPSTSSASSTPSPSLSPVIPGEERKYPAHGYHAHEQEQERERERERNNNSIKGDNLFYTTSPPYNPLLATLAEYNTFNTAFTPLLNHARSRSSSHENFLHASTLRMHWLAGYLCLASNNSRSALVNDGRYGVLLQELVGIAELLLSNGNPGAAQQDVQLLVPLLTVAWVYRHRVLRREAIELLLRCPSSAKFSGGEVLDGVLLGKVMAWLEVVEEDAVSSSASADSMNVDSDSSDSGRDSGRESGAFNKKSKADGNGGAFVPEWAEARCVRMDFDRERAVVRVSCLQAGGGGGNGRGWIEREEVIGW